MSELIEHLRTWDQIPDDDYKAFHWLDLKTGEAADLIEAQANEIAELHEERAKAIAHFPTLVDSARDKTGSCIVCGFHPEMAAMWCDDYLKLKALCDKLGSVLDGHCAPFLGHEEEHRLAIEAWRESK